MPRKRRKRRGNLTKNKGEKKKKGQWRRNKRRKGERRRNRKK